MKEAVSASFVGIILLEYFSFFFKFERKKLESFVL